MSEPTNGVLALAPAASWEQAATLMTPPDLSRVDEVELDFETTGLRWMAGDRPVGVAIGCAAGQWYLPFAHRGGGNLDEAVVKRWAQRELRGKRIQNLNLTFDLHMSEAWGVNLREQANTFHDVAHSAALLDDRRTKFSLNALAHDELGLAKADLGDPRAIAELPGPAVAAYACRDVELVRRLAAAYAPRLAAEDLGVVALLEDRVIPAVVEIEANGMPLDLDLLGRWTSGAQALVERLSYDLYRLVGFQVNPDKPTDMTRLFQFCGEPLVRTATGQPSFTAAIVLPAAGRHPAINLAWRIGKLQDLLSKYFVKYAHDAVDGVLYPTLHQLRTDDAGTTSGRFSCVRPNLQQVMAKNKHDKWYGWLTEYGPEDYLVKRLFPATRGTWVSVDKRQVEYRIFVDYSGSTRLLARYAANPLTDFHEIVGDLIRPARPDINRTEIKVFNFASLYGGQVGAAQRLLGVSRTVAQDLFDTYHAQFPEARQTAERATAAARSRGYVRTRLGRRARFDRTNPHERWHKALNAAIQGTAADDMKWTLVDAYEARRDLGLVLRMTVHDSLEAELLDIGTLPAYRELLDRPRLPIRVPLLCDVTTGSSYGDCH